MMLLVGGTTETAVVAQALAEAGLRVLVSTATDEALDIGRHANIVRRSGRLDAAGLAELVYAQRISAVVDVSHPYAVTLRETAERVAREAGIPYLTYVRPGTCAEGEGIQTVASHDEAARLACGVGRTVLLTVGSRNVAVYAREAVRRGVKLVARVLPGAESAAACKAAGLLKSQVVTGRGPFGVKDNRALIRRYGADVLVTKDSGEAGGFPAKRDAARLESCRLVVVGRASQRAGKNYDSTDALVRAVLEIGAKERVV